MDKMSVADFRIEFSRITEPTEVYARSEKKGTWFPANVDAPDQIGMDALPPEAGSPEQEVAILRDEVARLKRELAQRPAAASPRPMAITDQSGTRFVNPGKPMTPDEARAWIKTLPEQDQAFFASRLGIKVR